MSRTALTTRSTLKRAGIATLGSVAVLGSAGASFASSASAATSSTFGSSASRTLAAIKSCESGGSYTVVNSIGAGGAYQFLPSTWHGLGYSGLPQNASPATQDAAAFKLYSQMGTSPWVSSQSCWAPKLASGSFTGSVSTSSAASSSSTSASSATTTATRTYAKSATRANTATSSSSSNTSTTSNTIDAGQPHADLTPHAEVKLTDTEQQAIDAITAQQKQQPTWTKQAAAGDTITRYSVQASGLTTYTHTGSDFASAQKDVVTNGEALVGHYVNVDWFEITSGTHTGQYVSTATLTRHGADVTQYANGQLPKSALAVLPSWLSHDDDKLNPTVAKQLILTNAAFRADTGSNMSVTEGYRDIAEQYALRASRGPATTANPGDSNHGFGEAIDFATTFNPATSAGLANLTWMQHNAALFGFAHPSNINSIETWHYDFQG